MSDNSQPSAVLFADIEGSTSLYEKYGDARAQQAITQCLKLMSEITDRHNGKVIRVLGDEIMCQFTIADEGTVDNAIEAAIVFNETLATHEFNDNIKLNVRVGGHFGPAIENDGDLYGDAVNLAARVRSLARPGQILITQGTVDTLSSELKNRVRRVDEAVVKGRQESIILYEVLWEREDITHIMTSSGIAAMLATLKLNLDYQGQQILLQPDTPLFILGRGPQCDLVIDAPLASRVHARIAYRRGKFILHDQSTNGTFIRTDDGKEVFLKREELPLWGKGMICLGETCDDDSHGTIFYECE